jgi:hypothetical protein
MNSGLLFFTQAELASNWLLITQNKGLQIILQADVNVTTNNSLEYNFNYNYSFRVTDSDTFYTLGKNSA